MFLIFYFAQFYHLFSLLDDVQVQFLMVISFLELLLKAWFVTTQQYAFFPRPPEDACTRSSLRSQMYQVYSLKLIIDTLPLHTAFLDISLVA